MFLWCYLASAGKESAAVAAAAAYVGGYERSLGSHMSRNGNQRECAEVHARWTYRRVGGLFYPNTPCWNLLDLLDPNEYEGPVRKLYFAVL